MAGFPFFDVLFLVGLVLSVRVMTAGVERTRRSGQVVVHARTAILAGMCTLAGFIGALLVRLEVSRQWLVPAVVAGVTLGALSAKLLVARAVAMPVSDHELDPRFELQGVPAVVVEPIPADGAGLVQLPGGPSSARPPIPAKGLDGLAFAVGAEVGVERIDGGIAFVEAWSSIEARL